MCGGTNNYRTLSLFVGWLNVAFSITAVIYCTYLLLTVEQKLKETAETEESVNSDVHPMFENAVVHKHIIFLASSILLWYGPSILLIKGIKQNRHILLAPWIFMCCVSIAGNCFFLLPIFFFATGFSGSLFIGLINCLPLSFGLIFSILCLHPVRKLYKIMSTPPPALPTQCVMTTIEPEDHKRYMPIFEN